MADPSIRRGVLEAIAVALACPQPTKRSVTRTQGSVSARIAESQAKKNLSRLAKKRGVKHG